jgi:hypothetical protein
MDLFDSVCKVTFYNWKNGKSDSVDEPESAAMQ